MEKEVTSQNILRGINIDDKVAYIFRELLKKFPI